MKKLMKQQPEIHWSYVLKSCFAFSYLLYHNINFLTLKKIINNNNNNNCISIIYKKQRDEGVI